MRRLLVLACSVVFLDVAFFSVLTPLLPTYKADLGLTDGSIGVLAGAFAAGTLVFSIPAGWLVAKVGARPTLISGLVGIGLFSSAFGFADDIRLLDVLRFLQGGAGALMWSGAIAWVVVSAPVGRRGEMLGIVIAAAVAGELLGAPLGALAHAIGTEIVFGSVLVAASGLIFLAAGIPGATDIEAQPIREAWTRIRRSGVPQGVMMLAAPSIAFGLAIVIGPLHMDDLGASPFLIAAAFAAGSLIEVGVGPVVGRISDRVGRILPYLIGVGAMTVAIVALGLAGVLPLMFVAVMILAFGAGLAFTPSNTLITDQATSAGVNQGYASGASNVAFGGGQAIGAIGGGVVAGATGYVVPCLVAALLLVGGGMLARALGFRSSAIPASARAEAGGASDGR